MPDLLDHFQVLRYDTRGHGASATSAGDYTLRQLGQDVLALADKLNLSKFAFCGISMGGAVGQWLAINAPQRLTKLIWPIPLPNSAHRDTWDARRKAVLEGGMQAIIDATMQRFFSADNQQSVWAQSTRAVVLGTDPIGYAACCTALRDADTARGTRQNFRSHARHRQRSRSFNSLGGKRLRAGPRYSRAHAVRLETAHLSNLEQPRAFTKALLDFLL